MAFIHPHGMRTNHLATGFLVGSQNNHMGITQQTMDYKNVKLEKQGNRWKSDFLRHADIGMIKGMCITSDLSIDELLKKINSFTIKVGGQNILNLDYNFFKLITASEKIGNMWLLKMDLSPFLMPIPFISLQFSVVAIELMMDEGAYDDIHLLVEHIYLDTNERMPLAMEPHNYPCQHIQGKTIEFAHSRRSEVFCELDFGLVSKGYFIVGDIDNLEQVILRLNYGIRFDYNRIMLHLLGKRLNSTTLYIPLNNAMNWNDIRYESYVGGINHSRIDKAEICVRFNRDVGNIGVYTINSNTLMVFSGMMGIKYVPEFGSIVLKDTFEVIPQTIRSPQIVWAKKMKPIHADKKFCPIEYDEIRDGMEYCECDRCHNCFTASGLMEYFKTAIMHKCPLCRGTWTSWTVYTNEIEAAP